MLKRALFVALFAVAALAAACVQPAPTTNNQATQNAAQSGTPNTAAAPAELKPALDSINSDDLMRHIKTLSSDEYEGRGPGTRGEELSVNYLTEQFKRIGLKPGNPDGTYVQKVPLVGFTAQPTASFTAGGERKEFQVPHEHLAVPPRLVPES